MDVDTVASQGYCFQVDLAWRAHRNGFRVVEVPITFAERERGRQQDELVDRARGAVAGHRLGHPVPDRHRDLRARLGGQASGGLTMRRSRDRRRRSW